MARFYPAFAGDFHGSEGERQAYRALETLGDDYTVFHSYCWLGDGVRTAPQGEADFVVLHPRHGILAVEVKAGGISYEETCRHGRLRRCHRPCWLPNEERHAVQKSVRGDFSLHIVDTRY